MGMFSLWNEDLFVQITLKSSFEHFYSFGERMGLDPTLLALSLKVTLYLKIHSAWTRQFKLKKMPNPNLEL